MGQAQEPISPTTQQLNVTVATTTDDTGAAVWQFQTPPAGVTWTGTLVVSGGVSSATFTVYIGGGLWGTFSGGAVFGPVQIRGQGSQQLVVYGSGLIAATQFTMSLIGSSDADLNVQPIYPEPSSSATTVLQGNGSIEIALEADPVLYPTTDLGFLPAMNAGDTIGLLNVGLPLGGTYVAWQIVLEDTTEFGGATPRQWMVTANGVEVLLPLSPPNKPGDGYYVFSNSGYWNAYLSFSASAVDTVTVKLVSGASTANNDIQISMFGYSNSQAQQITNTPGQALGVSNVGGLLKMKATGPYAVGTTYMILNISNLSDAYTIRLHSITWKNVNVNNFSLSCQDDVGAYDIFTVSGTTNSQPQYTSFHGLECGTYIYLTCTVALLATFSVTLHYDIVPRSQPGMWL